MASLKSHRDLLDQFSRTKFGILSQEELYLKRVRREDGKGSTTAGPRHRLETGELMFNPNPREFHNDIRRQQENFDNLKVVYLEQETKEKFLRTVISDPLVSIDQQDILQIEAKNAELKAKLKVQKELTVDIENQLEAVSHELCSDYEHLNTTFREAQTICTEIDDMKKELQMLNGEENGFDLENSLDNQTNLSISELEVNVDELEDKLENNQTRLKRMNDKTLSSQQRLAYLQTELVQIESAKLKAEADMNIVKGERNVSKEGSMAEKERKVRWLQSMMIIWQNLFGLSDVKLEESSQKPMKFLFFSINGLNYKVKFNQITGQVKEFGSSDKSWDRSKIEQLLASISQEPFDQQLPSLLGQIRQH